jgi:ABC-type multidrug transport system fused ATPase/permease subunit
MVGKRHVWQGKSIHFRAAKRSLITLLIECGVLYRGLRSTWSRSVSICHTINSVSRLTFVRRALFTFAVGISTGVLCLFASSSLFQMALKALFFAPMTTFDTTPLGRLMGILTKDVDSVDNQLGRPG